jgi:hypothetical protein
MFCQKNDIQRPLHAAIPSMLKHFLKSKQNYFHPFYGKQKSLNPLKLQKK